MNAFRFWVKRHSFAIFLLLTFSLYWWWVLYLQGTWSEALLPLGPVLAALIVVPIADGWAGVKE